MYSLIGGLDQKHLCPVDRTELREAKARVDLPFYRAVLDEFGFSLDLLLHAIESCCENPVRFPLIFLRYSICYTVQLYAATLNRSVVCSHSQIKINLKSKTLEPPLYPLCDIRTVRLIGNDFTSAHRSGRTTSG